MVERRVSDRKVAGPGSIPVLSKRRCVVGKDSSLSLWPSLTKDLQTEPKKVLCVGVVFTGASAWFIPMNERTNDEKVWCLARVKNRILDSGFLIDLS